MSWYWKAWNTLVDLSVLLFSRATEWDNYSWPLNRVAPILWWLHDTVIVIRNFVRDLSYWLDDTIAELSNVLTLTTVKEYLSDIISMAAHAWTWVINATDNIINAVSSWWSGAAGTVREWIDSAIAVIKETISILQSGIDALGAQWDQFTHDVVPTFLTTDWLLVVREWIADILNLVLSPVSELVNRNSAWLEVIRDFIDDPLEYIKAKVIEPIIDEFIRGFDSGLKGGK